MGILKIAQNVLFTVFLAVAYPILILLSLVATAIRFGGFGSVKDCHGVVIDTFTTIWKK